MNIFLSIFKKLTALFAGSSGQELPEYSQIRATYKYNIKDAILGYLVDEKTNPVKYRNQMKKAMTGAFSNAFRRGYLDAGGDLAKMTGADHAWIGNKQTTEMSYIDQLFDRLKELKKEEPDQDNIHEVDDRSEGYAETLDGVYAEGRLRGNRKIMLTFEGEDGEESCKTCKKWKGKRHSADFWIKRGLIPGQPGNQNFECHGFNCLHILVDDDGNIWAGH
jgi:hypothetical protein